jgi:transcriptional regulator with XRE-family HTH domain
LSDPAYRTAFVASQINIGIPFQIRALLKERGKTQEWLAEKAGMLQPRISGLMTPGKTRPNIETLRRIAKAFDCGLLVRFTPFSELVKWSEEFDPEAFNVPSFELDSEPIDVGYAAQWPVFGPYDLQHGILATSVAKDARSLWPGYMESGNVALGANAEYFPKGMTFWGMAGVTHQNVPGLGMAPSQMGQLAAEHQISPIKGRIINIEVAKQRFTSTDILPKTFTAGQKVAVDDYLARGA